MDHNRRIGQLRRRIARAGLQGLLVTHLPDVRYLCGFTGSSAALAITRRAARLFTDGRYKAQAAEEVKAAKVQIVSSSPSANAVAWLSAQPAVESVGFDPTHTTVAELTRLRAALPSHLRRTFLVPLAAPLVEPLRWVKDEDELRILSEAALLGCKLFEHLLGFIHPGLADSKLRPSSNTRPASKARRACRLRASLPPACVPRYPTEELRGACCPARGL